jgi:hypothetical protein
MLIPGQRNPPGFDVVSTFRHLNGSSRVFAFVGSYLTSSDAFSATLTTGAFDPSRLRWFATCSCKPVARGLLFLVPSSPMLLSAAHSRRCATADSAPSA